MMYDNVLKNDERAVLSLRSLYKSYGYQPFKMSKFEEYDLYARNKDFLVSDRIITFTDTDGRLMALKPDVTLSIIKSGVDSGKRKVYYDENVYRVSQKSGQFREIMQTGIECIGDVDINDVFESIYLAAESLSRISDSFVLDISHMGVVSAVLDGVGCAESVKSELIRLISERNLHELTDTCRSIGMSADGIASVGKLAEIYGNRRSVLTELDSICTTDEARVALEQLRLIDARLESYPFGDRVRFDFSLVNNMRYYNGIVFKGFVAGISESVLSGGEYASLLSNMGKTGRGVGFALYLDRLEELESPSPEYDVDVLLVYSDVTSPASLFAKKQEYSADGSTVLAVREVPKKIKARSIVELK